MTNSRPSLLSCNPLKKSHGRKRTSLSHLKTGFHVLSKHFEKRLLASSCHACLFVRPHGTTRLPMEQFSLNFIFEDFRKPIEKIQIPLKSSTNKRHITWTSIYIRDTISLNSSWDKKYLRQVCGETKTHIFMLNNLFFGKTRRLLHTVKKNIVELERNELTNRAHALCTSVNQGKNTNTARIFNTSCFSTTMVTRTRLIVTLYVHCLFSSCQVKSSITKIALKSWRLTSRRPSCPDEDNTRWVFWTVRFTKKTPSCLAFCQMSYSLACITALSFHSTYGSCLSGKDVGRVDWVPEFPPLTCCVSVFTGTGVQLQQWVLSTEYHQRHYNFRRGNRLSSVALKTSELNKGIIISGVTILVAETQYHQWRYNFRSKER
jgi:hypothetical protein